MSWCDDGPCFQGSEYCPWCETEDHMEEIKRVHDTPPGGIVLDPVAGSGTTLQAALNKGFTPIGIEQDADYCELTTRRLATTGE